MLVWYSLSDLEKCETIAIKGDIEQIQKDGNITEVIIDEGTVKSSVKLDQGAIGFVAAINSADYDK